MTARALLCDLRWMLLLASGCSSVLGIEDFKVGDASNGEDAEVGFCLGPTGRFRVCLPAKPTSPFENTARMSASTDTLDSCAPIQPASWKNAGQPDSCFLIADNITISGEMRLTGSRPLVLLASGAITISASIEVASHFVAGGAPVVGAGASRINGAPPMECKSTTAAGSSPGGAGGGAGGSFMGKGGEGGGGTSSMGTRGTAAPADAQPPQVLRAGCPGGIGGNGSGGGGGRGPGGGAIYLVAGGPISINNTHINASGAAAGGGGVTAGGAGAGSGGMIVMHAPSIMGTNGVLIANGGGGGGGGGVSERGIDGYESSPVTPTTPPYGGPGSNNAGSGGAGAGGPTDAMNGTNGAAAGNGGGGGGGGGGAGYILMSIAPVEVVTSPPFVMSPSL